MLTLLNYKGKCHVVSVTGVPLDPVMAETYYLADEFDRAAGEEDVEDDDEGFEGEGTLVSIGKGADEEPIITHGYTVCTQIPFKVSDTNAPEICHCFPSF